MNSSTTTSSPHPQMGLGGWGIPAMFIILGIMTIVAIAIIVDTIRRPRYQFGKLGPTPYVIIPGLFLAIEILVLVVRFGRIMENLSGPLILILGAFTLFTIICGIAYLLDITFPDEKSREKRADYEAAHGIEPKGKKQRAAAEERARKQADREREYDAFEEAEQYEERVK